MQDEEELLEQKRKKQLRLLQPFLCRLIITLFSALLLLLGTDAKLWFIFPRSRILDD